MYMKYIHFLYYIEQSDWSELSYKSYGTNNNILYITVVVVYAMLLLVIPSRVTMLYSELLCLLWPIVYARIR